MKNLSFKNNFKTTQKISKQKLRSNLVMALIFAICFSMLSMFSSTNFESWAVFEEKDEKITITNDGKATTTGLQKYNKYKKSEGKYQIPGTESNLYTSPTGDYEDAYPSVSGLTEQARTATVNNSWKVRFDPNDGEWGKIDNEEYEWSDVDITNGKFKIPKAGDQPDEQPTPTRTNFKFLGWALTPDHSQLVSDSILSDSEIMLVSDYKCIKDTEEKTYKIQDFIGENPINADADVEECYITLYAVWGYDVVFKDSDVVIDDESELDKDNFTDQFGDFTIPENEPGNVPSGQAFFGWKVSGQASSETYSDLYGYNKPEKGVVTIDYIGDASGITPTNGVLTLEAVYSYKVFFDANLPDDDNDSVDFGNFGGQDYEFGAEEEEAAAAAGWPHKWADKKQQGKWIEVIPDANGKGSLLIPSQEPSLDGYKFVEWNEMSDGSSGSFDPGDTKSGINSPMVLYAQWENKTEIKFYDTKFGTDENVKQDRKLNFANSDSDLTVEISKVQSGGSFNLPEVTDKVKNAHEGEIFAGWVCQSGSKETYNAGRSYKVESAVDTIEFWAVWKKLSSVTFDISTLNGASFSGDLTVDSIKAKINNNSGVTVEINVAETSVVIKNLEPDTDISKVAELIESSIINGDEFEFDSWDPSFSSTVKNDAIYKATGKDVVKNTLSEITLSYHQGFEDNDVESDKLLDEGTVSAMPAGESFNADKEEIEISQATAPTRDGYTFDGWKLYYYDEDIYTELKDSASNGEELGLLQMGGTVELKNWEIFKQISGSGNKENYKLYLVAQWKKDCVIEYNANADSDPVTGMPDQLKQSVVSGGSHIVSQANPERDGYDFVGWNTEAGGSGVSYSSGAEIKNIGKDITLYAVWTSDAKISFYEEDTEIDLNALVLAGTRITELTGSFEDKVGVKLLDSSEISEIIDKYPNKVFVGWFCDYDQDTYEPGETYIVPEGTNLNIKFTAVWEDRLTVTFDISTLGGAKFNDSDSELKDQFEGKFGENNVVFETTKIVIKNLEPDTDISEVAELIESSIEYDEGAKTRFKSWDPSFSSKVTASANYKATGKDVVENILSEIEVVYYDGDEDLTGKVDDQDYKFNHSITIKDYDSLGFESGVHAGEVFAGWVCYINDEIFDSKSVDNKYWKGGDTLEIDITSGTIKFVAQWLKKYDITFNLDKFGEFEDSVGGFDGASLSGDEKTLTFNLVSGNKIPKITGDNVKIVDDYKTKKEFDGWDNEVSETADKNVVYNAKYKDIINNSLANNIKITYEENAGSDTVSDMPENPDNIKPGEDFKISEARPTRANHKFLGWVESLDVTGATYQPGDTISKVTGSKTLYAVWEEYFKVIFKNGDDDVQTLYFDVEDEKADSFNVPGCPTGVDEADFDGWSFDSKQYKAGEKINLGEKGYSNGESITFSLVRKSMYTVSYVDDDDESAVYDDSNQIIEDTTSYNRSEGFAVSSQTPVKENATFLGWNVSGANEIWVDVNDLGKKLDDSGSGNVILKAKWSYHPFVKYLDRDGTPLTSYYIDNGDVQNIKIGLDKFENELQPNYDPSFKYWSLKVDNSGTDDGNKYNLNGTYALKDRDKPHTYTFTAVYTEQFKVSYVDSDGSSPVYEYGTGTGNNFVAFTQDDYGNLFDSDGNEVFVKVTGNEFEVTNSAGKAVSGASRREIQDEKSYNQGVDYYTKVTDRLPYKENATFCGWEDQYGYAYDPDDMIPITDDITLKAVWRQHHEVKYVYEVEGSNVLERFTKYYDEGETVEVDKDGGIKGELLENEVKEDEFDGWYNEYYQSVYEGISDSFTMPGADVVIKPRISDKYQVVYKNGLPTGSTDKVENLPTDNNYYSEGDTVYFTGNPTRKGYLFDGWVLEENTTDGVANDGAETVTQYTIENENVTVYAKWIKKIKVKYSCGNGFTGEVPKDEKEYIPGESVTLENDPTWSGYDFGGWTVNGRLVGYGGDAYEILTNQKEDIVFVAKWENMYYVRVVDPLNNNTVVNSVGPFKTGDSTKNSDLPYWGQDVKDLPVHDGYRFKGLSLDPNATEPTLGGLNIIIKDSDENVYIIWKEIFDVEFNKNANDATLLYGKTSYNDVEKGESVDCPVITRTGYTFTGWNTKADGTGGSYEGTSIEVNSNLTLYAQWKENDPSKVTIKFINWGNQDSSVKNWPSDETVDKGSSFKIDDVDKPTSDFYDFVGWYNSSGGSNEGSIKVDGDIVLIATWTPKEFTITFDLGDGELEGSSSITKEYGEYINLPNEGEVIRDGFEFIGWANSESATDADYQPGENFKVTESKTLYAVWKVKEEVETYTVKFDANKPEGASGDVINVPHDTIISDVDYYPIPNITPGLEGYEFIGWANNESATEADYQPGENFKVTESKTLYAVWKVKEVEPEIPQVFNIKFNKNCDEDVENMPENTTHNAINGDYTLPIKTPWKLIEDGYEFNYWSTSKDESTAIYNAGSKAELTKDTTFYAIWKLRLGSSDSGGDTDDYPVLGSSDDDDNDTFVMGSGGGSGGSSGGDSDSSPVPDPVDAQESKEIQIIINHHYNKKNKNGVRELEGVDTDIMTIDSNGNCSIVDSHGNDVTDSYGDIDMEGIIDSDGNINIYKLIDTNFDGVDHVYAGSSLDDDNNMILNINEIGSNTHMLSIDFNYDYEVNTEGAVYYQVKHEYYQSEDLVTKTLDGVVTETRTVNGVLDVDKDELMKTKFTDKNDIERDYKYVSFTEKDLGDIYSIVIKYVRNSSVDSDFNISGRSVDDDDKAYVSNKYKNQDNQDKNKDINTVPDDLVDTGLPAVPCLVIILISMGSILIKFKFGSAKK